MPPQTETARQWFVSGEGIDRNVISGDIQRYLGNDATVRPGLGTGEYDGVSGYWIRAYRNLTTSMIADLRASSVRWQQEQRRTGGRGSPYSDECDKTGLTVPDRKPEPYIGSNTYHQSSAPRMGPRRDGDPPMGPMDTGYGGMPPPRGERIPDRPPVDDRMQIDPPYGNPPPSDRRFLQDRERERERDRTGYPPENRPYPPGYPPNDRDRDPRQPYAEPSGFGRPPVPSPYGSDPRGSGSNYAPPPPLNDGAPPGYVRQGNYYVPISSSYDNPGMNVSSRPPPEPAYNPSPYGGPPPPPRNDGRDPRYQPEYNPEPRDPRDPRYAYPSPAATVINPRDAIQSPPQPSPYGSMPPQYDQYGGRPPPPPDALTGPSSSQMPPRGPPFGTSRQPAPPTNPRDSRRRRIG